MPNSFAGVDFGQSISLAAGHGMGVAAYRAFAAGALTVRPGQEVRPTPSRGTAEWNCNIERARALEFLKGPGEATLAGPAIRWALADPRVATVLVGFSKTGYLDDANRYIEQGPLSANQFARIEELYAIDFGLQPVGRTAP